MMGGMKQRYRYHLYPHPHQQLALAKAFGCARVVWNDALAKSRELYAAGEKLTDRHIPENPCNSMGLKSLGGRGAMGAWGCETKPIPRGSPDPTPS